MGACYSKSAESAGTSRLKAPKAKRKNSKQCAQTDKRDVFWPVVVEEEEEDTLDVSQLVESVQPQQSPACEQGEHTQQLGMVEAGVAPSDSGIESIGTVPEEVQEVALGPDSHADLSKRLERLSRGSCHKCGNFKLDDSALTALLTDTYCLCGPKRAGHPSVNPQCQTHGSVRNKVSSSNVHSVSGLMSSMSVENSPIKSSLKKATSRKRDASVRISVQSVEGLEQAVTYLTSGDKSGSQVLAGESPSSLQAPLATFDSVDTNLDQSPSHKRLSRRSLLSEILDLTDSICKCDFYSNEFCCSTSSNPVNAQNGFDREAYLIKTASPSEPATTLAASGSATANSSDIYSESHHSDSNPSKSSPNCSSNESPSKKSASLPKNVSFANHQEGMEADEEASRPRSPTRVVAKVAQQESSLSEVSSGVYTHNSTSESCLASSAKGVHKRSLSLGSRGMLLSDSSSEAVDGGNGTEDDMASLDLDSLSRVTSLSYSSIRQLMESTEDLVEPLDTARRMYIDGEDCVVIPTETYRQMQADLDLLKQELYTLSSLMLQEMENMSVPDTSNGSITCDLCDPCDPCDP